MSSEYQIQTEALTGFLKQLLIRQVDDSAQDWLLQKLALLESKPKPRDLYLTFSAIPRFLGKNQLEISEPEEATARELRKGLSLTGWSVSQTARVLALCTYQSEDAESFLQLLDQLFTTAEVTELVALYSALPVLPYPLELVKRASEGIRTNMSVVFDAVVLNNPYPCDYLDEPAWNQMVLKALFMERPLYKIYGLEQRANLELSRMISNFAHERWAAHRPTSPEMWRPVGIFQPEYIIKDLEKLAELDDPDQKAAAILTAQGLDSESGKTFLKKHQEITDEVIKNKVTWTEIGIRWWKQMEK